MAGEMDSRQGPSEPAEAAATGENEAGCGEGCACHAVGAGGKIRMVIGQIVVVIALVLVARAFLKNKGTTTPDGTDAFSAARVQDASAAVVETVGAPASQQGNAAVVSTASDDRAAGTGVPSPGASSADEGEARQVQPVVCGETIRSLNELSQRAMASDGVFVFLAGEDAGKARDAIPAIEKAAEKIRGRGTKLDLFTLKNGSAEFRDVAVQVPPPGVLAMVKGRGASAVTDGITEAKLLQAFVTASSASGCGPSGCGPTGCP